MNTCLFCHDVADANTLAMTWSITMSTGRVISAPVIVCLVCSHTRRTTVAEVFDLARRRSERSDPHAATT